LGVCRWLADNNDQRLAGGRYIAIRFVDLFT
jgi:hypothetical protein